MKYPKLEPVPIPTKGLSSFARIRVWLFSSRKWKVVQDWEFDTKFEGKDVTIFIEKDFIFDGASIPRSLWWLLSPIGILLIPGLVHDYAYRHQRITIIDKDKRIKSHIYRYDRHGWDRLFRDISTQINGFRAVSYSAWTALFAFGKSAWKKNREIERKKVYEDWKRLNDLTLY